MDPINNNLFEVVLTKSKRKIATPCPNVYLNPALDLLANEDPMCNNAMEIVPVKKRKRTQSCDIAAFENSALDLGISKAAVNEFLVRELENVKKNVRTTLSEPSCINSNLTLDLDEPKPIFMPNIAVIKPNISFKDTKTIETQPELDLTGAINTTDNTFDTVNNCIIDLEPQTQTEVSEPIYANLTHKNIITDSSLPDNNVSEVQITSNTTTNAIPYIDENEDMSILPEEPNVFNSMVQNCMDISKIDNDVDLGISVIEQKSTTVNCEGENTPTVTNIQTNITNQLFVNNTSMSLSFIDRLALDSPNMSNSLVLDDDLNESNIMEIKTITIITKKKRIHDKKKNTNPFLDPNLNQNIAAIEGVKNPFLNTNETTSELEYNEEMINRPLEVPRQPINPLMPRKLFAHDTNSTISTMNESVDHHEYENIDGYRSESPIYENVGEMCDNFNKQSKILGCDVSQFSAIDIMNLNKNSQANSSNESNDSKKDLKHQFLKVGNKLSKKVLKKLKRTFKGDKHNTTTADPNATLNPYEIPRKLPKEKVAVIDSGIENPALNLDTSDIEIEEIEDDDDNEEHQYETIKTLRNTRLNMNVTPLRERNVDNLDFSQNRTNTPSKKVRFDSTLNQEKIITGNSFDYGIQSPGFDAKIDKYHDELENCINEKKFLQQNM